MRPMRCPRSLSGAGVRLVRSRGIAEVKRLGGQDKSGSLWRRFAVGFSLKVSDLRQAVLFDHSLSFRPSRCSDGAFGRLRPS